MMFFIGQLAKNAGWNPFNFVGAMVPPSRWWGRCRVHGRDARQWLSQAKNLALGAAKPRPFFEEE
jgi:hypothetical protein